MAVANRLNLLVIAWAADRYDDQTPGVKESLQFPMVRWVVRGVHGLVVLPEELAAFALGEVPEDQTHRLIPAARQQHDPPFRETV